MPGLFRNCSNARLQGSAAATRQYCSLEFLSPPSTQRRRKPARRIAFLAPQRERRPLPGHRPSVPEIAPAKPWMLCRRVHRFHKRRGQQRGEGSCPRHLHHAQKEDQANALRTCILSLQSHVHTDVQPQTDSSRCNLRLLQGNHPDLLSNANSKALAQKWGGELETIFSYAVHPCRVYEPNISDEIKVACSSKAMHSPRNASINTSPPFNRRLASSRIEALSDKSSCKEAAWRGSFEKTRNLFRMAFLKIVIWNCRSIPPQPFSSAVSF